MADLISVLYFLCEFLIPAHSLYCPFCEPLIDPAQCGDLYNMCPYMDAKCISVFSKSSKDDGSNYYPVHILNCGQPSDCGQQGSMTQSNRKFKFATSCCDTDNCKPNLPEYPPDDERKNGLFCPSCYTIGYKECEDVQSMECTGVETYCVELVENNQRRHVWTGCGTENFCDIKGVFHFMNFSRKGSTTCTKPKSNQHTCYKYTNWMEEEKYEYFCLPDEDVCLSEYIHTTYVDRSVSTERVMRCGKSSECNLNIVLSHPNKTVVIMTTCCTSNNCLPPTASVQSMKDTKPKKNGLICNASCSTDPGQCISNDTMYCTGIQNRCVLYTMEEKTKHTVNVELLAGCGTTDSCAYGKSFVSHASKSKTVNITCTTGSANKITPGSILYFYSFAGLIYFL